MKNLILLVIMSLFILPVTGLAGGKLQIEDTAFDLKASTTTQCNDDDIISIRGNVIDMTGKGAGVPDAKVTWKGKRSWGQTTTDVDGGYKLCGLLEGNYTLGAYHEEGFGSGGFTIINFREDINYYPTGFPVNIYLYKGEVYDKGSIIRLGNNMTYFVFVDW